MLRWLGRLLLIGLILGGIGFAVSRFLGQDDDFDDFDDIEEGFEYTETPVEIDVPANTPQSDADATQALGADATQALGFNDIGADTSNTGDNDAGETTYLASAGSEGSYGSDGSSSANSQDASADMMSDIGLQEIKGIGAAYEQRLIAIGINNPSDLISADPSTVSEQLNVIGGQDTVEDWISQARDLATAAGSNSGSNSEAESNS